MTDKSELTKAIAVSETETETERLRRELRKAEEREREQVRERQRQEELAAEERRVAPLRARATTAMDAIVAALTAAGFAVERSRLDERWHPLAAGIHKVDGVYVEARVFEKRNNNSWRRDGLGVLQLTFGGYGKNRQFPEGKNGLSVEKIVDGIKLLVASEKAAIQRQCEKEAKKSAATVWVKTALEERGLSGDDVPMTADEFGRARVVLNLSVEPERAGELLDKLLAAGLIKKPEAKQS